MISTLPAGEIATTRQAIRSGQTSAFDALAVAARVAASQACRHVYMPDAGAQLPASGSGPLTGIAVSIKDLFDVAGQTTAAGSTVLAQAPAATQDCTAVARLRAAGATLAGRTNMVEFAFSGVGINPHYGTPVNPADAAVARIPGGSSSGAAVSVATGAALAGLGSDTGGSIRIPAALCF
jgi:aspartyl-tRNA(Asn)/glutamyl-tRNA(Gln) amidotransferase subunit A